MGSIMIDDQKAIDSLNKVNKKGEETGGKLGKIAGVGLKAGAAIGAGAIAGGAALLGLAGNAAGTADRIDKLAAKSGLSKTAFQEWDYVMGQNGMSIEKMQTGMKTLVQQMDGVQNGSKKSIFCDYRWPWNRENHDSHSLVMRITGIIWWQTSY